MKAIKKFILPFLILSSTAFAQIPNGSIAPNFTLTDMNGKKQDLYSYLNAGKSVVIDVSATWCGPCWNYHNSGNLESFYKEHGPAGDNKAMVLFIEGDGRTNNECVTNAPGCNVGTRGDWVKNTPYPVCNPDLNAANTFDTNYGIAYYPTMYFICAKDKKIVKTDQYTSGQLAELLKSCPVN